MVDAMYQGMDSGGDIRRMDAARVWTGNREAP